MKNIKWLAIGIAMLLLVLLAVVATNMTSSKDKQVSSPPPRIAKVLITAQGFKPAKLTIKTGTTVTWTNADQVAHRLAANPHPEHTNPKGLFSPVLNEKDTYSYTFTKAGNYGFHDEINPTTNGSLVVKD